MNGWSFITVPLPKTSDPDGGKLKILHIKELELSVPDQSGQLVPALMFSDSTGSKLFYVISQDPGQPGQAVLIGSDQIRYGGPEQIQLKHPHPSALQQAGHR